MKTLLLLLTFSILVSSKFGRFLLQLNHKMCSVFKRNDVATGSANSYGDEVVTPAASAAIVAPQPSEQAPAYQPAPESTDYGQQTVQGGGAQEITTLAPVSQSVQETIAQEYRRRMRMFRMRRFRKLRRFH